VQRRRFRNILCKVSASFFSLTHKTALFQSVYKRVLKTLLARRYSLFFVDFEKMYYFTVITALCQYYSCSPLLLEKLLRSHQNRQEALTHLKANYYFECSYGAHTPINCDEISPKNASTAKAYQGYLQITVQQHYYCKRRIALKYSNFPLIVQRGNKRHIDYFPMELIYAKKHDKDFINLFEC